MPERLAWANSGKLQPLSDWAEGARLTIRRHVKRRVKRQCVVDDGPNWSSVLRCVLIMTREKERTVSFRKRKCPGIVIKYMMLISSWNIASIIIIIDIISAGEFFSLMLTKSHVAIRNSNYWAPVISPKSIINYPVAFMQIISIYIFLFLLPFSFPFCKTAKKWSTSCHVRCWFSFWNTVLAELASGIFTVGTDTSDIIITSSSVFDDAPLCWTS